MEHIYLPEPTENIWKKCAEGFENRWGFPNCIGSVDGKHVTIKRPNNSGSNYWCYLHKYSIVLMAIVGPDHKCICIYILVVSEKIVMGVFSKPQTWENDLNKI
ncbi:unnamed protein product [Acanthoscelides obtectus]|uniref:DDE Tnp4 domain-containing protein n=1 Tax=Acanthoscelides obtectus TaxID=200917 RepID=A0A9P0KSV8_ACAOB|nr:unnamed protein product [Acanthoscelides obtectus]CAK1675869.1 hypothetical protein AOBTE_LOCUS30451 [Acanthoscelides obtectus]